MSRRYKGGVISATAPTTSTSAATGVWTLPQQMQAIVGSGWPSQPTFLLAQLSSEYSGSFSNIYVDATGNIYTNGYQGGTSSYAEVVKYNSLGVIQWQRGLDGLNNSYGIVVDSSGNVTGTCQLAGTSQWALIQYNSAGTTNWKYRVGNTDQSINAVAIDSSGNIYGGGTALTGGTSPYYMQIVKYNSSGTIQWQYKYGDGTAVVISGSFNNISIDSSGNIYFCGRANYSSTGGQLFKLDTSGAITWQKNLYQGVYDVVFNAVTFDTSGNVYCTGAAPVSGGEHVITAKYNSSGTLQWQKTLSAPGAQTGYGIAVDSSGNVYVVGGDQNTKNGIVAKYDSSGAIQWQRNLGSSTNTYTSNCTSIKIMPNGALAISGNTSNTQTRGLFAILPTDGSKTGSYTVGSSTVVYAASSYTDGTSTFTSATTSYTATATSLSNTSVSQSVATTSFTSSVTQL